MSEMKNMDWNFTNENSTVHEEMNGVKENVEGVWTVMKTGKEEVTNKITAVKKEVDKLRQEMTEIKKGQGQLKVEIGKNTNAIQNLKQGQQETNLK